MLCLLRPAIIRILLGNDTAPIPMVLWSQDVCWRRLYLRVYHLIRYTLGHVCASAQRRVERLQEVFSLILILLVERSIIIIIWRAIILILI